MFVHWDAINGHDEPQGLNYSENGAKNSDSPETYCLKTVNNSGAVQSLIRNFFYLISGHPVGRQLLILLLINRLHPDDVQGKKE